MDTKKKHIRDSSQVYVMKSEKWINRDIEIDFPIPPLLQELIDDAEEAERKHNHEYFAIADAIDVFCKGLVSTGYYNEYQWDIICARYPQ